MSFCSRGGKLIHGFREPFPAAGLGGGLVGRSGVLVGQGLVEVLAFLAFVAGVVERDHGAEGAADDAQAVRTQAGFRGDLVVGGVAAELNGERGLPRAR